MTDNTNVTVTPIERDEPDLRRLAQALIDLAIEQSQQQAEQTQFEEREAA